jgi:hypothetical protein
MQLLPGNSHGLASFQVFDSPRYFLVPSLLHGFIRRLQTVEQCVSQRGALLNWERQRLFQKIGNFWTHRLILHVPSVPQVRPRFETLIDRERPHPEV